MGINELATPAVLVDRNILQSNIAAMASRARELGCRLRPHVKTHKCPDIARLQLQAGASGITVSTMAEARAMVAAGIADILYAVPVAPDRVPEAIALHQQGHSIHLLVDGAPAGEAVSGRAAAIGVLIPVWLKVDCGAGRAGVDPEDPESMALALHLAGLPGVRLAGVLTHAGQAYGCSSRAEIAAAARRERDVTVAFGRRLRAAGLPGVEVSIGSTPTLTAVDHLAGVDEVRPGNYVYFDATQVALGSCSWSECALTVLATVIGCYPRRRRLLLDAGALALSKDPGPRHLDPGCGFGRILDPGYRLLALTQEHATVEVPPGDDPTAFPVGTRLRVVPNHSCLAAACFDHVNLVEGDQVVARWPTVRGW